VPAATPGAEEVAAEVADDGAGEVT
jgi:hypothetical protein